MVRRRLRFTRKALELGLALGASLLAACSSATLVTEASLPAAFRDLVPNGQLRVRSLAPGAGSFTVGDSTRVVVTVDDWRVPDLTLDLHTAAMLRAFVERGGKLLLLGYATALANELGVEDEHPEVEAFRWGYDARTSIGRARLGIEITSGRAPELFAGLVPTGGEFRHYLTGGTPCCVPLCAWRVGAPRSGDVLARLATEFDGIPGPPGPPVLVRWRAGKGEILGLGLAPDLEHADEAVRDNARRLLRNLLGVREGVPSDVVLIKLPAAAVPERPRLAATFDARDVPMQSLLAHWGWSVSLAPATDRERPRAPAELVREVLAPSWRSGADLLEIAPCHPDRGLSLIWSERDAMKPPPGFRGSAYGGAFDAAAFGLLADEAHGRGMLLQALLDPLPFGERTSERLAALRFVARQLACVRRLGGRAIDGFGVRDWLHDDSGYSRAMVQDLHPAAFFYTLGERAPAVAGALRGLDAEDGALRGLGASGLSDSWRAGFPHDLFPLGVLDARVSRALPSEAGATYGGGSYGDWIVTQANDFVRARQAVGGALWWRTHDAETLGPRGADYVHGVSLDPLRAAVAMPLAATGANGYRAAAAALASTPPAGFADALPVAAAVHVLQNNWLRLVGSGGGLLFDPAGEARFRPGEALVLSPGFLQTRLFGSRPEAGVLKNVDHDLLVSGSGTEGGYGRTAVVGAGAARVVPAMLAFDEQPRWPQRVQVELALETGYYELELQPRCVRGRGILISSIDGTVVDCRAFVSGERAVTATVPVHIARDGTRILELAVAEGGTVALDRLRLVRRGDVAAEGSVAIAAGHLAEVGERSASSYHSDSVELRTIGDFPGLLLRVRCLRAVRNLRVERTFALPSYTVLAASGGDGPKLRQPFVLRSANSAHPDLVVVPIQLQRYEHLRHHRGGLVLHGSAESGAESRIGFWLTPHGQGGAVLAAAAMVFRGLDQPIHLDLGDRGEGELVSELSVPWTRVVHVQSRAKTPYFVRENGWWTWRGAQPAATGGDWLRVCQLPGDTVVVTSGPAVFARTRPGIGSQHVLALRDPEPHSVRVRVLQPSRLSAPAVIMAADFDEVSLDGEPWSWFDDRTVYLPDRPGDYLIETQAHGGDPLPRVTSTRAPVQRCAYDPEQRELLLVCGRDPSLPAGLPFTAVLKGPRPTRVTNGEIVAEATLPHADADARARAAAGGVLIRFRPGVTKVHYDD